MSKDHLNKLGIGHYRKHMMSNQNKHITESRYTPKTSSKIMPNQIEAKEREDSTAQKDIRVLRTAGRKYISPRPRINQAIHTPPFLNPANNISAQSQRIRNIQNPPLCPFENIPLIDQIIQNLSSLCQEFVQPCFRILKKRMLI